MGVRLVVRPLTDGLLTTLTRGKAGIGLWKIAKMALERNHEMGPDPFQFVEHRNRDPDRDSAILQATGLRAAGIKFK